MKIKGLGFIALCALLILFLSFASGELQKNAKTVVSNPAGKGYPAVSFNAQAELYLVVWQQRSGSGEDRDVMARVLNRDGSPAGDVIALASTGEDERLPKTVAAGSSWTVVWSTGHSIESCAVDATGKAGDFRTVTSGPRPVDRPEIGPASLEGASLVVWEELDITGLTVIKGRGIHALAGTDGEEFLVGRSPDYDLRNPVDRPGRRRFVRRLGEACQRPARRRRREDRPVGRRSGRSPRGSHRRRGRRRSEQLSQRRGAHGYGRLLCRLAAVGRPPELRSRLRERDRRGRSSLPGSSPTPWMSGKPGPSPRAWGRLDGSS